MVEEREKPPLSLSSQCVQVLSPLSQELVGQMYLEKLINTSLEKHKKKKKLLQSGVYKKMDIIRNMMCQEKW